VTSNILYTDGVAAESGKERIDLPYLKRIEQTQQQLSNTAQLERQASNNGVVSVLRSQVLH
jgi:hypothetical protein